MFAVPVCQLSVAVLCLLHSTNTAVCPQNVTFHAVLCALRFFYYYGMCGQIKGLGPSEVFKQDQTCITTTYLLIALILTISNIIIIFTLFLEFVVFVLPIGIGLCLLSSTLVKGVGVGVVVFVVVVVVLLSPNASQLAHSCFGIIIML